MSFVRKLPWLAAFTLVTLPAAALDVAGQITANGHPVADAVVYVEGVSGGPSTPGSMMQKGLAFQPGVVVVRKGQSVAFPNQDSVFHSVYASGGANNFDIGLYMKGPGKSAVFNNVGQDEVQCHIHKTMKAHIITVENGYFTKTDAQGRYALHGVPAGARKVTVWLAGQTQSKPWSAGTLNFAF